ncbi:MAG: glycosyltransferase family 9 protein [Bacteroidia bacterium]|nr:glycosyltransferase family 9 protein [Bacteroidia bacterium]
MRIKWPTNEQLLFMANVLVDKLLFRKVKQFDDIKEILVIKWDEIGDMVVAVQVFESLKLAHPKAKIHLICKPFVKSLVENDPHIDFIQTTIDAYNRTFDLVVELRGTWKSLLKTFKYFPKNRCSRASIRYKNKGNQLHEIDTNSLVIQPFLGQMDKIILPHLYFSDSDVLVVDDFLQKNSIHKFAIIHAGARKRLRQWPLERFALAAQYLYERYQYAIVFAGTEEDEADIKQITNHLHFETFLFTRGFSLSQFSCLCSKAHVYLGNESGPLQIASTFGLPTVALFGPGVKDVFYPQNKKAKVLHYVLDCNPCDQVHCVLPDNPCMNRIQIEEVLEALDNVIL